jgi:uncharacterized protein (TIGR02147 family)
MKDARGLLNEILSERIASNARYSLRAFARDLEVSPQQLSNVMTGRRGLSAELAEKITAKLNLDAYEKSLFIESMKANFSRSKVQRSIARGKLQSLQAQSEIKNLEMDLFKAVSNWYHFALIELIKLASKKKNKVKWFAAKLGISENEALLALSRLERLELITKTENGWTHNQDVVIADRGIPTESVRNYHRQILEKATQALAFQTQEERYGSSSTIPIKVKSLPRAKKLIQDFRLAFDQEISDTENGEEVYGLSLQFFRLTQKENEL